MPLNDIANRLTPSVPMEITFGAQPVATGRKLTTLFGHMASAPGTGTPYQVYTVLNVGDPVAAETEVAALAGVESQISEMAAAFVNANAASGGSNFPAFRVVLIPFGVSNFGPNSEAINAVKALRSDMFVSCYPASDSTNAATLLALANLISGIDRDLMGQFGSFMTVGSLDPKATNYHFNSRTVIVAHLPDANTASVPILASTTSGSPVLTAVTQPALTPTGTTQTGPNANVITSVSSVAGIYPGASITGTGIPANTTVAQIIGNTLIISQGATSANVGELLTITNLPAAGIYPGAVLSGTGIPSGSTVLSVAASTITMNSNASSTNAGEAVGVQNMVSQPSEIVAAAHAARMMASVLPYAPLNGVTIGGLIPPQINSDHIQIDPNGDSEAELNVGNSPLYVQAAGTVGFIRTRTSFVLLADNVTPATAYIDWQDIVALFDFREDMYGVSQNPPFNNNPGGSKATQALANFFKDELIRVSGIYEDAGAFQNVKQLAPFFVVQPSTTSRGRFDFRVPEDVTPGLMVLAGNIVAISDLSQLASFTL